MTENELKQQIKGIESKEAFRPESFGNELRHLFICPREDVSDHLSVLSKLCEVSGYDFLQAIEDNGELISYENLWDEYGRDVREGLFIQAIKKADRETIVALEKSAIAYLDNYEIAAKELSSITTYYFFSNICRHVDSPFIKEAAERLRARTNTLNDDDLQYGAEAVFVVVGLEEKIDSIIQEITDTTDIERKSELIMDLSMSKSRDALVFIIKQIQAGWMGIGQGSKSIEKVIANLTLTFPEETLELLRVLIGQRDELIQKIEEKYKNEPEDSFYGKKQKIDGDLRNATDAYNSNKNRSVCDGMIYESVGKLMLTDLKDEAEAFLLNISDRPDTDKETIISQCLEYDDSLDRVLKLYKEGSTIFETLIAILKNNGVRYGQPSWDQFIQTLKDWEVYGEYDSHLPLIAALLEQGSVIEPDTLQYLCSEKAFPEVEKGYLVYKRPTLLLAMADWYLENGTSTSHLRRALDFYGKVRKRSKDVLPYRNKIIAVLKENQQKPLIKLHAVIALVAHARFSEDLGAIDYLVTLLKNELRINPGKMSIDAFVLFKPLLKSRSRLAQRTIAELLADESLDSKIHGRIIKSSIEEGIIDGRLSKRLVKREDRDVVYKMIRELIVSGLSPTLEVIEMVESGRDIEEVIARYQENKKIPWKERLLDDTAASLEFSCAPLDLPNYSNTLSFARYREFVEEIRKITVEGQRNDMLLHEQWQKFTGDNQDEFDRIRKVFENGIEDNVITVVSDVQREQERRTSRATEQVFRFREPVERIVLLDNILGRIVGLNRALIKQDIQPVIKVEDAVRRMSEFIGSGASSLARFDTAYQTLFELYDALQNQLRQLKGQETISQNIGDFKKDEILKITDEQPPMSDQKGVLNWYSKKLHVAQKKVASISDDSSWSRLLGDVSLGVSKMTDSIDLRSFNEGKIRNSSFRIQFVSKNDPVKFMRIGDARESCIANDGSNKWTIPAYYLNEGTGGLIITDEEDNLGVGHCMWHLRQTADGIGLIVNGIYLNEDIPRSVAEVVAKFIDEWSQKAGLINTRFALDPFADAEPEGWEEVTENFQLLQSYPDLELYYDFMAPLEEMEPVSVLKRAS